MVPVATVDGSEALDVRRPDCGSVAATVSHVTRGEGNGGFDPSLMSARDYKLSGKRNADSVVWADLRHKGRA